MTELNDEKMSKKAEKKVDGKTEYHEIYNYILSSKQTKERANVLRRHYALINTTVD